MRQITHRRANRQLPQGVSRGVWDYARAEHIARDYDTYFADTTLFERDMAIVIEALSPLAGRLVVDLGCGTGRAIQQLSEHGARCLAVDLSHAMLQQALQKAPAMAILANFVELDCVADQQADHAICLFSTLGMIRGRANRRQALEHVARILKPQGLFVLHIHNAWRNLLDAGRWNWFRYTVGGICREPNFELGDKVFPYRGIPNFFLHTFWPNEIRQDVKDAGLTIMAQHNVSPNGQRIDTAGSGWAAGGWVFVCQRS